ncbi:MAG: hypothetical protein L0Y55_01380, partial [Anaerolineales bacterium]|nr:hypothetical protein [Anaerolineales bacterium]
RLLELGLLNALQKTRLGQLDDLLRAGFFFDDTTARWYLSKTAAKQGRKVLALMESKGQLALDLGNEEK